MAALNSQTAVQFQQYAAQQYPGSSEQQQRLVRQLQEQHYQQYMQQLYQVQLAQQQVRRPASRQALTPQRQEEGAGPAAPAVVSSWGVWGSHGPGVFLASPPWTLRGGFGGGGACPRMSCGGWGGVSQVRTASGGGTVL